jgi:hypothetical protein
MAPTPSSMIAINSLTSKDIGRWVVYQPDRDCRVRGRLKSWTEDSILVVYGLTHWEDFADLTAMHTDPEKLDFDS